MIPNAVYEQLTIFGTVEYIVEWPDGEIQHFADYPTFEQTLR